jgi:hypothetical protein
MQLNKKQFNEELRKFYVNPCARDETNRLIKKVFGKKRY